jgi:hypothetical protein
LGNALVLVVFLDPPLGLVLFLHDAREADYLPANAIASAAPAKEISRRGNHDRGIRRTADQTPAGCQYEIEVSLKMFQTAQTVITRLAWISHIGVKAYRCGQISILAA